MNTQNRLYHRITLKTSIWLYFILILLKWVTFSFVPSFTLAVIRSMRLTK